jgi:predicted CoA-binding protein
MLPPSPVAVLGASPKPSRYAYIAAQRLNAAGHRTIGINPQMSAVNGIEVVAEVPQLPPGVHTLTIYVSPEKSAALSDGIIDYGFTRVIFNPGAENPELAQRLRNAGVDVVEACTLVMLSTGEF